jgi:hypothetical protein
VVASASVCSPLSAGLAALQLLLLLLKEIAALLKLLLALTLLLHAASGVVSIGLLLCPK